MADWKEDTASLSRSFVFPDFTAAIAFISEVALIADELNHHPEINNVYNKVTLTLSTHDAGDIVTEKDRELARRIDAISPQ